MTEEELQVEIERLYESESLTDELMDEEADILLKWGEKQISQLAKREGDFGEQCRILRELMKRMNLFVGQGENMDFEEKRGLLHQIGSSAAGLGYTLPVDALVTRFQIQMEQSECLEMLLSQFQGTQAAETPPVGAANPVITESAVPVNDYPPESLSGESHDEENDEEIF